MTLQPAESVLIVDFGSQVTQLIARRVREAGVYSEIAPYQPRRTRPSSGCRPRGIILSGGPSSVLWDESPRAPQHFFDAGVPILAICYGQQAMAHQLGGRVAPSDNREFGRAFIEVTGESRLFDGLWKPGELHQVWMSHGDRVEALPDGFSVVAKSEGAPYAVATDEQRRFFSLMFHPEVVHTPDGGKLLANFVRHVCGLAGHLDDGRVSRRQDRRHPRPGRQGQGDLRAVGRSRFGGRRRAHPRGNRRAADLRVRRPRPDAPKRGRAGRQPVPGQLQHPARPCAGGGGCSSAASRA